MSAAGDRKQQPAAKGEHRKAKSRDAARQRRGLECTVFDDMLAVLPLPSGCKEQLDKASVVRLTISAIKLRQLVGGGGIFLTAGDSAQLTASGRRESVAGCPTSEALNLLQHCFLLLLSEAGDVVFVTDNISKFMGTTQLDLIGNRIFDFLHPCDHDEVKAILHEKTGRTSFFFSRFRCIQQPSGRTMPSKSAAYKVVKFSGHTVPSTAAGLSQAGDDAAAKTAPGFEQQRHLLLTGELIPNPSAESLDELADDNTFVSCHSLDMKFTACDAKAQKLIRYDIATLVGSSLYDYVHGCDCRSMEKFFKSLYSKGQSCSGHYRFLCKGGGYVWVMSKASVVINRKSSSPQHVECIHTVVSGIEDAGCILSSTQQCSLRAAAGGRSAGHCSGGSSPLDITASHGGGGVECPSIIEDTEALFSELNCRSDTSSSLPSPMSGDAFADDDDDGVSTAAAASAAASVVADCQTGGAGTDEDIYACTSGLFQDETFGDATQTLIFDDPAEGLLIDTSCLDEYLDEDMSQRAPYIPMNMGSDEVFAASVPARLPSRTERLDDQWPKAAAIASDIASAVPPLIGLPCSSGPLAIGVWGPHMQQSSQSQSLGSFAQRQPLLLGSLDRSDETRAGLEWQAASASDSWLPAHLRLQQPTTLSASSSGGGRDGGRLQLGWPYPAAAHHLVQPPPLVYLDPAAAASDEEPRFPHVSSLPDVANLPDFPHYGLPLAGGCGGEPWELVHCYESQTGSRSINLRQLVTGDRGEAATTTCKTWTPTGGRDADGFLQSTGGAAERASLVTNPIALPSFGVGRRSKLADCLLRLEEEDCRVHILGRRVSSSPPPPPPLTAERRQPRVKRLASTPLPGGTPRKKPAVFSDYSSHGLTDGVAEDIMWHSSDVAYGAGKGAPRWTPLPHYSRESHVTECCPSETAGAASGFSGSEPTVDREDCPQLPTIGVEDLLFLN